jgi:hypothetical protein
MGFTVNGQMGRARAAGVLLAALLVSSRSLLGLGCGAKNAQAEKPPAVDVEVVQVGQKDVPIYGEWIGTLDGMVDADVKAQVTGYLLKQAYAETSRRGWRRRRRRYARWTRSRSAWTSNSP